MKGLRKIGVLLLALGLIVGAVTPVLASGSSNSDSSIPTVVNGYPVPKEIGGLPVIFVETSDNAVWLQPGQVHLIILDTAPLEESIAHSPVPQYLSQHPLPDGWLIYVVGPDATQAELQTGLAKANAIEKDLYSKFG